MHVCRRPVAVRGAVNISLPAVAVYIALVYRQCAVAKFCPRVWDKVSEGSKCTLIFGDALIYLKHSVA